MSDLISRQDAIALVDKPITPTGDAVYDNAREDERTSIKDDLLSLPSAEQKTKCVAQIKIDRDYIEDMVNEMAKQKTGRWTWDDKGYFHCDRCGKKPNDQTRTTDYCPNCGSYNGG